MEIRGLWSTRCNHLVKKMNEEFTEKPFINKKTTPECAMLAHLNAYGKSKYKRYLKRNQNKTANTDKWLFIIKEIERLLRTNKINNDNDIAGILAECAGITTLELVYHTMSGNGEKQFFPSSPASPTSYLPLIVTREEALKLYNLLGFTSISDIKAKYLCTRNREMFMKQIELDALNVTNRTKFNNDFYKLYDKF